MIPFILVTAFLLCLLFVCATDRPPEPVRQSLIDVEALRQLQKHRQFGARYGIDPQKIVPLQKWQRNHFESYFRPRISWRQMEHRLAVELGYKVMGNMLWDLTGPIPPRMASKAERAFWSSLVDARIKAGDRTPLFGAPSGRMPSRFPNLSNRPKEYADDGTLSSICRARQG